MLQQETGEAGRGGSSFPRAVLCFSPVSAASNLSRGREERIYSICSAENRSSAGARRFSTGARKSSASTPSMLRPSTLRSPTRAHHRAGRGRAVTLPPPHSPGAGNTLKLQRPSCVREVVFLSRSRPARQRSTRPEYSQPHATIFLTTDEEGSRSSALIFSCTPLTSLPPTPERASAERSQGRRTKVHTMVGTSASPAMAKTPKLTRSVRSASTQHQQLSDSVENDAEMEGKLQRTLFDSTPSPPPRRRRPRTYFYLYLQAEREPGFPHPPPVAGAASVG